MEILPGEVGSILLPKLDKIPISKVREILDRIDHIIRKDEDIEIVLDIVDNEILVSELDIERDLCFKARGIWKKMQYRRLKRS